MTDLLPSPLRRPVKTNAHGGSYMHGKAYGDADKARVLHKLIELEEAAKDTAERHGRSSKPISKRTLAKEAKCSATFALKVITEWKNNSVTVPSQKAAAKKHWKNKNHGAKKLGVDDELLLLDLREAVPGMSLASYQRELVETRGTMVSKSTISAWWNHAMPFAAAKRKTNRVPMAKFSAVNMARLQKFQATIAGLDPRRIKFTDEKACKAAELLGDTVRADPFTGLVPPQIVPKDWRFRQCITGLCSMDAHGPCPPVVFSITEETTTAESFKEFIIYCVAVGFLVRGDVLVLDNAAWHTRGAAEHLDDLLWNAPGLDNQPLNVLVVFLPTYSAELNPIEKVWNIFINKKRDEFLFNFRNGQLNDNKAIVDAMSAALRSVTFSDVEGCYKASGYFDI